MDRTDITSRRFTESFIKQVLAEVENPSEFFFVKEGKEGKLRGKTSKALVLNIAKEMLVVQNTKGESLRSYDFSSVRYIRKSADSSLVRIGFKGRDKGAVSETYSFSCVSERELFCSRLLKKSLLANFQESELKLDLLGEFSRRPVSIFVGTFNMGNLPPPEDLTAWLGEPGQHDVYALGFQEATYDKEVPKSEADLKKRLLGHIGAREFHIVAEHKMMEISIMICTRNNHLSAITSIDKSKEATGIGGVIGNKGAVGVSLRLYDTSLAFVCAHLAARAERLEERGNNYSSIVDHINLGRGELDLVSQFDHLFFFGDLNYRIDMERASAIELIKNGESHKLLDQDQLKSEMENGKLLVSFREGQVTWNPTYRYVIGSDEFSEKKNQTPSYCDRVLFKSMLRRDLRLMRYFAAESIKTSDHRPVGAEFELYAHNQFIDTDPRESRIVIPVVEVEEMGADKVGLPGSYLSFESPALEGRWVSTTLKKSANKPRWEGADIPDIIPIISHKEYLMNQYLIVAIQRSNDLGHNYVVAATAVPLHKACHGSPVLFSTMLTSHGRIFGKLKLAVLVKFSMNERNRRVEEIAEKNVDPDGPIGDYITIREMLNDSVELEDDEIIRNVISSIVDKVASNTSIPAIATESYIDCDSGDGDDDIFGDEQRDWQNYPTIYLEGDVMLGISEIGGYCLDQKVSAPEMEKSQDLEVKIPVDERITDHLSNMSEGSSSVFAKKTNASKEDIFYTSPLFTTGAAFFGRRCEAPTQRLAEYEQKKMK